MADKRLQKIFKEAAEIAASVPEPMRELAFNRAVDMLLEKQGAEGAELSALFKFALAGRDLALETTADALSFASRRLGREEMTAEQLSDFISDRIGMYVPTDRIATTLATADGIVKGARSGGKIIYRMVRPAGEKTRAQPKSPARARTALDKPKTAAKPETPAQLVTDLVTLGFFRSARTVSDVLAYLEQKGLEYSAQQLTPALMHLIRAGLLSRSKNRRGVYIYRES